MQNKWHLEDVKNPISLIIEKCLTRGPQICLFCGKEIAAIVSINEYTEMSLLSKLPYYFLSPDKHHWINRNGEKIAVVLPYFDYLEMKKNLGTLSIFFRESPLTLIDLRRDHTISPEEIEF